MKKRRGELAPRMGPTGHLGDRPGLTPDLIEPSEAGIGIALHQPGIEGQMALGMGTAAIARVEVGRRRRVGAGERPIVAHIDPKPAGPGLACRQHRHGGVIGMETRRRKTIISAFSTAAG